MSATSQQLFVLLLLAASWPAARKGKSRDRHFAMVLLSTVVNAADADHAPRLRVRVWHRMAVCFAHDYAVSIASPGGGPLSLWARSTTWTSIMLCYVAHARLSLCTMA